MFNTLHVILICLVLNFGSISSNDNNKQSTKSALLVVSYDAFRLEYFHRNITPYMNALRQNGTSAEYMQSVFPTKTFVNHFTIATGLYPGVHGVLSNSLYDRKLEENLQYGYDLFHYNMDVQPIWTLNELSGGHSGCMMWPGTNYPYQNQSCTFTELYNETIPWTNRVDTAISWFTDPITPANLVLLYIEDPDSKAHIYSTNSTLVTNIVAGLDNLTKYIQDQLEINNQSDRVNVVHLSDHGMTNVASPQFIDINQWLTSGTYKMYQTSPVVQIIPNYNANETDILRRLQVAAKQNGHFNVYTKDNVPRRWHIENEQRMGPILLVADVNYGFQDLKKKTKKYLKKYNLTLSADRQYGIHGYDNVEPSMRAIFFANGPLIRENNPIGGIRNIDLYHLFCSILDIKPNGNNGTMALIDMILIVDKRKNFWIWECVAGSMVAIGVIAGVIVCLLKRKNKRVYVV